MEWGFAEWRFDEDTRRVHIEIDLSGLKFFWSTFRSALYWLEDEENEVQEFDIKTDAPILAKDQEVSKQDIIDNLNRWLDAFQEMEKHFDYDKDIG